MSQVLDKENPAPIRGKDEVSGLRLPGTPLRAPLQEVNIPRAGNLRKSLYTQITPCGTPTPPVGHPLPDTPRPVNLKTSKVKMEGDVHLNLLIYHKINDIIEEKEKEHKKIVAEKDSQIAELQEKLEQQEEDVPESATNSTDCVDKYVNSVIHGAVRTLLTDRAGDVSGDDSLSMDHHLLLDMCDDSFVVLDKEAQRPVATAPGMSSAVQTSDIECPGLVENAGLVESGVTSAERSVIMVDAANSPCPTPRLIRSIPRIVVTQEERGHAVGRPGQEDSIETRHTPVETTDTETMCTPIKMAETETMFTPIKTFEAETMYTPVKTAEVDTMCSPIKTIDTETMCIAETTESETMCTPIKTAESETMCTPIKTAESETMCTPIKTAESETMCTPIKTAESETMCTPVKTTESQTMFTPVKTTESQTMCTPVKTTESQTMFTPVKTAESETMCTPVKLVNSETMYTPVKHVDADTMFTPIKLVDAGTECSVVATADHETSCTDLPSLEEAPKTPPRVCCDMGVGTSPFMPPLPRPSELEFRSMSPSEFSSYLETATISNSLLRSELTSLQRERQSMCQRLGDLQALLAGTEQCKQQALRQASAEADQTLSSLQRLQKSQMEEIAELQQKITAKDAEMAQLNSQHHSKVARLRDENANLQKDLKRAYKLHKQEMSEREAEWRNQDYRPYYEQAQLRIQTLQAQLEPFHQLRETLDVSCHIQDDLQKHLDDTYAMLMAQSEKLKTQRKKFLDQYNTWQKDQESKDKEVAEMIEGTERLKTQFTSLIERADVAESELNKLQKQHESTVDELKCSKELVANLSTQVEEFQLAMAETSDALSASEERASLYHSQEQLLEGELARLQTKLDGAETEMMNMVQVNGAYEKNLAATQAKLDELNTSEASLRTELNSALQQKQEAINNLAYLQGQIQRLQVSQTELTTLRKKVQNLSQTSKETEDFLGAERRLLTEELAETKANFSVKSMELSRVTAELENQKMAYEEAQFAQQQLRCEMQEIQDELDHTKVQAHYMLLQQGTEISDAIVAADDLHSTLQTLSIELAAKVETWTTSAGLPTESPKSSFTASQSHQEAPGSPESSQTEADSETSTACAPIPESGSAFRQIGTTSFRPSISNQPEDDTAEGATKTPVCEKILEAMELMGNVVGDIKRLERAVIGQMLGLQEEVADLREQLHCEQDSYKSKETHRQKLLETLRARLEQQRVTEQELRDQLASLQQQRSELDAVMLQQCQQQAQQEQRIELIHLQQANKKLSQEVTSLTSSLQCKESEVDLMRASLDETLANLQGSEGAALVTSIKENLGLKKEVKSLRMLNLKLKHDLDDLSTTAKRRMQRYQHNWQTAESEVNQLDDLLDQVRQLMMNHASEVRTWSDVKKVYELGLLDKSPRNSPIGHQSMSADSINSSR